MKKRITLKIALTIGDEATVRDVIRCVNIKPFSNIHLNYKIVSPEDIECCVLENGHHLSFAAEL